MVSVLPDPAPAMTTAGASGASIIGICSLVGSRNVGSTALIRLAISSEGIIQSPADLAVGLGRKI
ncbi:unannotated protein [freshwater metagenome]|uniref:Unannotated protein n=1 Tax=freshwater metagenome TaxID=449393 RepID=A0A6J5ZFC8_9ZZZZ